MTEKEELERILKREETPDREPPFRALPVGHDDWYSKKAQAILDAGFRQPIIVTIKEKK